MRRRRRGQARLVELISSEAGWSGYVLMDAVVIQASCVGVEMESGLRASSDASSDVSCAIGVF